MIWTQAIIALASLPRPVDSSSVYSTTLKKTTRMPPSSRALAYQRIDSATPLHPVEGGKGYNVDIAFGDQTFEVCFDTGSSDLWVPSSDFQCVGPDESDAPQSACALGEFFNGGFSGGQIADQHFNISYGSGEFLLGMVGYEDVSLAGITIPNQEVALVNYGFWTGDGVTSGLLGFAYPFLSSAFQGTDPSADKIGVTQARYNPFFFNAMNQGLVNPVFSLILDRDDQGSQLTLGGLPENLNIASDQFVPTPIIPTKQGDYAFYAIIPDGFLLQSPSDPRRHTFDFHPITASPAPLPLIVDSGTTLVYLPNDLASQINAAFSPPSSFIPESGVFENSCDAIPPTFAVRIGGQDFHIRGEDLLLQGELGMDTDTGGCVSGVQPGGEKGPFILGDVWLRNVVSVFDVGGGEMRFAVK